MRQGVFLVLAALTACSDIPRDPDGTLDHIRASGEIRVGIVDDVEDARALGQARRLIGRLEEATGARASIERGGGERLLPLLEAGELDLVLARFDRPTPWKRRVALTTPIAAMRLPPDPQDFRAAAPKGENGWIALVENQAYAIREPRQ